MSTFYEILTAHSAMYPDMQPQDYAKLAFQSEFGCGHLLTDREAAYRYLCDELDAVKSDTLEPMTVDIGGGYARLNLSAVKTLLPPEIIFRLFEMSCEKAGSEEGYRRKLTLIVKSAKLGIIKADPFALETFFSQMAEAGIPSHSPLYKRKYGASYRLIKSELAALVPACVLIYDAQRKAGRIQVAIEGRAATGKTTAAGYLTEIFDADVLHMDDFFLPVEKKTTDRLAEPGGNIDYERFSSEIAGHILDREILYHKFDCGTQKLSSPISLRRKDILLVEGVYSLHPMYRNIYTVKIFVDTDPVTQRERLTERGGEALLKRYLEEWIPLEEHYFRTYDPAAVCDLRIRT